MKIDNVVLIKMLYYVLHSLELQQRSYCRFGGSPEQLKSNFKTC